MHPMHRQWIYRRRPDATVGSEHYELRETPLDGALGAGEVLIEARYFSVDPYMRIGQSGKPTYDAEPHPLNVVQQRQTAGESMMKKLIALFMMLCAAGTALAANPSFGSHGMLLFGGPDALYASHLPMFHAPHDYQVILQVRLADKAQDTALRARLRGGTELWTLDPEKFDLDRFAPGAARNQRFKADLVLGHFEQGGKTQYAGAGVIVEKVLYFRQLSATPARSAAARYLQLGDGAQRFLVKQIDSRPDFDHVVAVKARPGVRGGAVVLAKTALQQPSAAAIVQGLPGLEVVGTVYFSTDDLR